VENRFLLLAQLGHRLSPDLNARSFECRAIRTEDHGVYSNHKTVGSLCTTTVVSPPSSTHRKNDLLLFALSCSCNSPSATCCGLSFLSSSSDCLVRHSREVHNDRLSSVRCHMVELKQCYGVWYDDCLLTPQSAFEKMMPVSTKCLVMVRADTSHSPSLHHPKT
jgi:hypothetical protein